MARRPRHIGPLILIVSCSSSIQLNICVPAVQICHLSPWAAGTGPFPGAKAKQIPMARCRIELALATLRERKKPDRSLAPSRLCWSNSIIDGAPATLANPKTPENGDPVVQK